MNEAATTSFAKKIMLDFANLTGLEPVSAHPKRYLWTDAFAVCNYLELFHRTEDGRFRDLALRLVDQVHHTLGRHREDDSRTGWISGLREEEGEDHPTKGGLRIGKPLNERRRDEPPDPVLEWEQDGQYYHYLTKWMHALNRVGEDIDNPQYVRWAIELAKVAHAAFTHLPYPGVRKRIYWKMSIDLRYPLASSMGQHDAIDGLVTCSELQRTATTIFKMPNETDLGDEIADMKKICRGGSLVTDDPLGIGGLLFDASRVGQLISSDMDYDKLLVVVLESALLGLGSFAQDISLRLPAERRLAFRELGLSIGLKGMERFPEWTEGKEDLFKKNVALKQQIGDIRMYEPIGDTIDQFWSKEENRKSSTWAEHREINMVMLATSLAPYAFLRI